MMMMRDIGGHVLIMMWDGNESGNEATCDNLACFVEVESKLFG